MKRLAESVHLVLQEGCVWFVADRDERSLAVHLSVKSDEIK